MPAGDRRGPQGMGPTSGRGAGYCAGHEGPGYTNPGPRMRRGGGCGPAGRWGGGFGRGCGWRHGYHATGAPFWARHGAPSAAPGPAAYAPYGTPPSAEEEVAYLRSEAEYLREKLEVIVNRIEELEEDER
jgi:hypothetical protein